LFDELIKASK